jgi:hypothetical protein
LHDEANGAGVGLEARRRFCPPCGVGQWFISGRSLATFNYGDANPEINPQISFESLKSSCHRHV